MKTNILRKALVSVFVLVGLAMVLAAGTHDGRGFVGIGNALPPTILVVTNANDSGPGSLRNALAVANDGDTIDATSISGTILLTGGALHVTHDVTINGPGAASLAVNGNGTSRVFETFAPNVTISGFTITNGSPPSGDSNGGGGILNHGGLTISSSIVSHNDGCTISHFNCSGDGGGINTRGGMLMVTNSVVSSNGAGNGGGISGTDGATVTIIGSTINGNGASVAGGGIHIFNGQLAVMNSTVSSNLAYGPLQGGRGGGIYFYASGMLTVTNSTISSNSVNGVPGAGGGIFLGGGGTATVTDSTFSDNGGGPGGSILNGGEVTIGNTVLNDDDTIDNSGGMVTSLGYNLASDAGGGVLTGPGDQINTDPMLGPLQDNGGPTFTHALLPGSPAINAGNPNFTPPPLYDQRGPGFDRVVNGRIDIGSFEVQGPVSTPTPTPTATPTTRPSPTPRGRPTPPPHL